MGKRPIINNLDQNSISIHVFRAKRDEEIKHKEELSFKKTGKRKIKFEIRPELHSLNHIYAALRRGFSLCASSVSHLEINPGTEPFHCHLKTHFCFLHDVVK